jgi:sugar phosphate isomerase/epimerase
MKGPGIFLIQYLGSEAPFNTLEGLAGWASGLGFKGVQMPTFRPDIFDLEKAASSKTYCDEIQGMLADNGLEITELSTHRQGHICAFNPAYDHMLRSFGPPEFADDPKGRQDWARQQMLFAAKAAGNLGLKTHASFCGNLLWPYFYPYPPAPSGLIDDGFTELARIWRPILDAFDEQGVDVCFEIHPGEDVHDGTTFQMLLDKLDGHPRCNILYDPSHMLLQHMDYLGFIEAYHERIKAFHVKDAEFIKSAHGGVYGGFQRWGNRAGRFRSLGDGQVDFKGIFSRLAHYGYEGWAVLEWECYLKRSEDGAREAVPFINNHIIDVTPTAFDDFMTDTTDHETNRKFLGID